MKLNLDFNRANAIIRLFSLQTFTIFYVARREDYWLIQLGIFPLFSISILKDARYIPYDTTKTHARDK